MVRGALCLWDVLLSLQLTLVSRACGSGKLIAFLPTG